VKVFLLSVAAAIGCAVLAEIVLTSFAQVPSEAAYASVASRPDAQPPGPLRMGEP
jgi:hypothetical protein